MTSIIFSLISLGILDSLNPASIATLLVLLPLVRKRWHSLIYIFGTLITYLLIGLSLYYGVDRYLKNFLVQISGRYSMWIAITELVLGIAAVIGLIVFVVMIIRKIKNPGQKDLDMFSVKSAAPYFLVGLSITATLSDAPTAIPYFGFIGVLVANPQPFLVTAASLLLYCFLYILPILILYIIYNKIQNEKFTRIQIGFKNFINKASLYVIPVILLVVGAWLSVDGLYRLL